jgi:hypothetical protein
VHVRGLGGLDRTDIRSLVDCDTELRGRDGRQGLAETAGKSSGPREARGWGGKRRDSGGTLGVSRDGGLVTNGERLGR